MRVQVPRVLGPKFHTLNGFWSLKPYDLGTWTLRDKITIVLIGTKGKYTARLL